MVCTYEAQTSPSRAMITAVRGTRARSAAAPTPSRTVSSASGPYAAEASASRPRMGRPASGPTRSRASSRVESLGPRRSVFQSTCAVAAARDVPSTLQPSEAAGAAASVGDLPRVEELPHLLLRLRQPADRLVHRVVRCRRQVGVL